MTTSDFPRRVRCAVYTRKSTDEGLEREYNTIEAQRDGGHAYITSRKAEGWIPVADDYDDPAWSGGSLDRPAMQRLLADIRAGRIDVVVAYKLDRLSRSLLDFAELMRVFDEYKVTFVSVTQHFSTTDAMGRLLLNIMLTFAQFEREVAADRVRDKMIASKKKGLWMHGVPPLGYDVKNRRLAVNETESELVRFIFRRFAETGSAIGLVQELRERGAVTKRWTTRSGKKTGGKPVTKSLLYKMLVNRTYLGELRHREQWFPEGHPPIVDKDLWEAVQAILATPGRTRGNLARGKVDFLLKGLVFDAQGRALTPWHTTKKNGRCYRYYLSTRAVHEGAASIALPRLPAAELESAVLTQLRRVLRTPEMIAGVVPKAIELDPSLDEAQVTVAMMMRADEIWEQLFPAEQQRLMRLLVERVIVTPESLELRLHPNGIEVLADELRQPNVGVAA